MAAAPDLWGGDRGEGTRRKTKQLPVFASAQIVLVVATGGRCCSGCGSCPRHLAMFAVITQPLVCGNLQNLNLFDHFIVEKKYASP